MIKCIVVTKILPDKVYLYSKRYMNTSMEEVSVPHSGRTVEIDELLAQTSQEISTLIS